MELTIQRQDTKMVEAYWELLRSLSFHAKLQLAALLTQAALDENEATMSSHRTAAIRRRAEGVLSDAELAARFEGLKVPPEPEDPSWSQVISSNTGKTITSIEKWL